MITCQAPVCACRCEDAPLGVAGCAFMRDFANHFARLVSSLVPCPHREPTEQRHYCTKGKMFYSQFVPFIRYRGKARTSPVTELETAYGRKKKRKDDLPDAGGSGGKGIEDLNVFFRRFPSAPSDIFLSFFFLSLSSL